MKQQQQKNDYPPFPWRFPSTKTKSAEGRITKQLVTVRFPNK